ncbi:DUF4189 domain-containing protein [Streptomyces sp. NPDC000405]|uniref:DUF4189 domain-containing protein n=1 Tax=Streptomyces sp. NPDC000405 TaxID=3161033 RepID=UPI00398C8DD0
MTADRSHPIDHGSLDLGQPLGQGGQGTVYPVNNKRINQSDGGGWDVVYKEYDTAVLPGLEGSALQALVDLLGELDEPEGRWLCEKTAWPAVVVQRQACTSGFLMRAAPDRFHFEFRTLSGSTAGIRRLANLEYLLNDDSYVAGVGLVISDRDRLLLLADLATTLAQLHRIGIAVGDLSPKNLLFTTDPKPECFLIDCDAMRLRGATVLPQAETPDWQLPEGEEKATCVGDAYKLGLLAIRLFARDQTATDPADLAATSPVLARLAHASLDRDTAQRPTPTRWAEECVTVSATASWRASSAGNHLVKVVAGFVAVAVVILAVILGHHGDSSGREPDVLSSTTSSTASTELPLPDDMPSSPSATTEEPTTPAESTTDPTAGSTLDDTTEPGQPSAPAPPPAESPPEAPPQPVYYGSIAVSREDGRVQPAYDYSSQSSAEQAAMSGCGRPDCEIMDSVGNGCGAVVYNPDTDSYWHEHGATPDEATNGALSRAGGGRLLSWVCTAGYGPGGSSKGSYFTATG